MSDRIHLVRNAIDNIMNDVMQKAYHHIMNYPRNTDYINKVIKDMRIDHDSFVNQLHLIKELTSEDEQTLVLHNLTKSLKKKSLVYLLEIQKLQEIETQK